MLKFFKKSIANGDEEGQKRNPVMRFSREMSDGGRARMESDAFVQENYVPPDPEEMDDYSSDEESLDVPENREELRALVVKFYRKHDPSKDSNGLDSIVDIGMKYGVSALNESLIKKYGEGLPFDELGEDVPSSIRLPTEDETDRIRSDLLHKLEAFYTVHDPSKFDNTEAFYSLVEWGMRYGIPLLNEKLVTKYGEGMEGVAVPKRSTVKRNTENWRKSGLPQPSLPTYDDDSDSEYDEDDFGGYNTQSLQGDDHRFDDEEGRPEESGTPLKFAQKLFPSGLMNEFEVSRESMVPSSAASTVGGNTPCGDFHMDLNAKDFGMCTCGYSKDRHGPGAFGSFNTTDMETVHTSLKAQWDKHKTNKEFEDPRETRNYQDTKISAVWAKEEEASEPAEKPAKEHKEKPARRDTDASRQEKPRAQKPAQRKPSRAPAKPVAPIKPAVPMKVTPPVKPTPPAFLQSSNRPVNNFAPNPKIGGPRIPQPKQLVDGAPLDSSESDGPCDNYVLDLTGAAYGNCRCGFSRAAHDKAKYRPKVAMSLRMKWDESPYRSGSQTHMASITESGKSASPRSAIPEQRKKSGILRGNSGPKLVAPEVSNPKFKEKSDRKERRPRGSSSSRRHGSQAPRKPSKAHLSTLREKESSSSTSHLKKYLKDLSLDSFTTKMTSELGVESVSDLEFVLENDLEKIGMKPIQRRKLLKQVSTSQM